MEPKKLLWGIFNKLNKEFFNNELKVKHIGVASISQVSSTKARAICNPAAKIILFSVKYFHNSSYEELEWIMYHEMCHLIVPEHNAEFELLMKRFERR